MKRILYALFFVLLFTTFAQAQATKGLTVVPKSQRHALLIGINAYPEPVAPLKFCVKDMQDLAAELEKVGFPAENVHLMVDSSKGDMKPTGVNIRAQIAKITGEMKEGDFLFVAFSGHGVLIDGKSYLCPIDIDTAKLETFVDREAMFRLLDECKASRKIFLCDACRNEFTIKGTKGKSLLKTRALDDPMTTSLHGFILMSSCSEKQQSLEYPSFGNGVFTHFLLEGLRGAAANEKGYVSVMRLFSHANERTINFTRGSQTPMFRPGGETSDFIIAKVVKPTIRPELPTIRIEDISGKISWGEIEIPPAEEIVVEDLTLPPVPEEITRPRIEIQLIQEAIRQLENGTHPALQQSREAVTQAKEVLDQAEKNFLEVDAPRKESWEDLPEETQKTLTERIAQNPTLKTSAVRDLCPEDVSFVDFAKMVNEGKRVAPVRAEYLRVKAEYDKLTSDAEMMKESALKDLKLSLETKQELEENLIEGFKENIFFKMMEKCEGFNDVNAEFPFDELLVPISGMVKYEFNWNEKGLFQNAEIIWKYERPCVINKQYSSREIPEGKQIQISNSEELIGLLKKIEEGEIDNIVIFLKKGTYSLLKDKDRPWEALELKFHFKEKHLVFYGNPENPEEVVIDRVDGYFHKSNIKIIGCSFEFMSNILVEESDIEFRNFRYEDMEMIISGSRCIFDKCNLFARESVLESKPDSYLTISDSSVYIANTKFTNLKNALKLFDCPSIYVTDCLFEKNQKAIYVSNGIGRFRNNKFSHNNEDWVDYGDYSKITRSGNRTVK